MICDTIVLSLLKRWKRLETGIELSAEAYTNLNKRFRGKIEGWFEQDKAAQDARRRNPESMDIYDISKEKGTKILYSPIYSVLISA
jgi:hypothetical protein